MSVVVSPPTPALALEESKTASVFVTNIPVPITAEPPSFKLVKVRKPDGTIVTVKRPISKVARPRVPAATAVDATSDDKPATSSTDGTEPTSAKVEPLTAALTEVTKVQVTNNETKVAETLNVKPEKRKISLSWLSKKEKPTTISDEKAETPKSPFAKLRATLGDPAERMASMGNAVSRIGAVLTGDTAKPTTASSAKVAAASDPASPATAPEKPVATSSIPTTQPKPQHHTTASKNGLKDKLEEGAAAVGLAAATGLVLDKANSPAHTAEEAAAPHHPVSKDTSKNTSDASNNNNNGETNAYVDPGVTNYPEVYDDWYSDDEEVDPNDIGSGEDGVKTQAVDAGESGPIANLSVSADNGDDDIEDFNPDTDELFDEEVDPSDSAIYDSTGSQALGAGASGLAVNSSAQGDDSDDVIEDFNPDTDELYEEAGDDEGNENEGSSLNVDEDGDAAQSNAAQSDNLDDDAEFDGII